MDKRFKRTIIAYTVLNLAFVFAMLWFEFKNLNELGMNNAVDPLAISFRKDRLYVWAISFLLSFLYPLLFLLSKSSKKLSEFYNEKFREPFSGILFSFTYLFTFYLVRLPISFYYSFVLGHRYGLSNQSIFRFLELSIKGFLVSNLIIIVFVGIPYLLIRKLPRSWWVVFSFASIPVIIFSVFIYPAYIDPIFNTFKPLDKGELRVEIEQLQAKANISDANIYVVEKSVDTKAMNAYMTGIASTKRIVLWDNTINNLSIKEVVSITAHEIGHYVKGHIWKGIFLSVISVFVGSFSIMLSANWILKVSKGYFGFKNIENYASLPLLLLLISLFSFIISPIENYVSREHERQADLYEISITEDRASAAKAMLALYETNLGVPRVSKLYKIFYSSHPSLEERIDFYKEADFEEIGRD